MKWSVFGIWIILALGSVSCFEEDEAVPPYNLPEGVDTLSLQNSIYDYQVYVDLSTGSIVSENANSDWVLSFECADTGTHIRINSSDFWGIARTGSTDLEAVYTSDPGHVWRADRSDGNPDSTAVGSWVRFEEGIPTYTNEVYLLGKYDGIAYKLARKVQFISVSESAYRFLIDEPGGSDPDTIEVLKDARYNYSQFSLESNSTIQLEPEKEAWDLLFQQYYTILFTDDGVPTPYYVRGVLLNPNGVEAALDTLVHFLDINYALAIQMPFSSALDAIGHDWKSVEVDEASNSAEYKVRPGYTYLVRDANNELYKLRFKSYFNKSGVKGCPSFEFARLSPG
ncbi:MAG: HmuY family protein [Bacteroidales bacterium]|nr:HmuY family protein [Bacteroidales bacterium]